MHKSFQIYGIVHFSKPLYCAADALAQTVDIEIGGLTGALILPSRPYENSDVDQKLVAPSPARNWKRGEKLIYWGMVTSLPGGESNVELALIEFTKPEDNLDVALQQVHESYPQWLNLFEKYVVLLTTQYTRRTIFMEDGPGTIEVLINENEGLRPIHRVKPGVIVIEMTDEDESLHHWQLKEASQLASKGLKPRLEYQLLLEAYSARKKGDYRKSIIEAATALEVCITNKIIEEFKILGINFGNQLLEKFRMLGGRLELAKMLGIQFPPKDYMSLVINPRNDVIHRAEFPDKKVANQVITEVELLLKQFSPQLYQVSP